MLSGFVRRVRQTLVPAASAGVSQTDERWFLLALHAAVPQGDGAVERCALSKQFRGFVKSSNRLYWVIQVLGWLDK